MRACALTGACVRAIEGQVCACVIERWSVCVIEGGACMRD